MSDPLPCIVALPAVAKVPFTMTLLPPSTSTVPDCNVTDAVGLKETRADARKDELPRMLKLPLPVSVHPEHCNEPAPWTNEPSAIVALLPLLHNERIGGQFIIVASIAKGDKLQRGG